MSAMKQIACFVVLLAWLFTPWLPAHAQHAGKVPRIGYISGGDSKTPDPQIEAFQQGLQDLGYADGKNILIEYRYQQGKAERAPTLVAEVVKLNVNVLVVLPSPSIRAAKQATKTIPIIMATTADPVATGLIDSLARPGGNITGLTRITRDLNGKRLELLKDVLPTISRVAVLFDGDATSGGVHFKEYESATHGLKIELRPLRLQRAKPDLAAAFHIATKERVNALITITNSLTNVYRKEIAELALKNQLPTMFETNNYAQVGGLMSYSANETDQYRRIAVYVDKVLKGARARRFTRGTADQI